ncbi:MAG: RnfABCDGE type electron transport complex subunit G [Lachnospiraceae bacterium]|nr:RnfABCDGE type electron transport complex subunit G [Lachnospiraceae bacterium]
MNKLIKDALILTAITLIAGTALGLVYEITKEPIAKAQEAATQEAYKAVFSDADSFTEFSGFSAESATEYVQSQGFTDDVLNCVVAKDATGNDLGYVITMQSHAGYGGDITFSMGVRNDGTMNGYSITDISETAGLGMKSKEEPFMSQFRDIAVQTLEVVKGGKSAENQIDAISGATITSKAVTNAVNAGFAYFNSIAGGN